MSKGTLPKNRRSGKCIDVYTETEDVGVSSSMCQTNMQTNTTLNQQKGETQTRKTKKKKTLNNAFETEFFIIIVVFFQHNPGTDGKPPPSANPQPESHTRCHIGRTIFAIGNLTVHEDLTSPPDPFGSNRATEAEAEAEAGAPGADLRG